MVYMITYDLNKQGKDYDNLIQAIKDASTGAWCSYWKSSYLIKSNLSSAEKVFDKISPYIDSDDRVLVIEVTKNYWGWLESQQWEYIQKSILD